MLINILGPDGCGKTTQISKLEDWIPTQLGLPVRRLEKRNIYQQDLYPECTFLGASYETLAHQLLPQMYSESRAMWLFYMLAVSIRHYPVQKDEIVLADGYWQKHYATEAALGLDPIWLKNVCSFFPEPDLTLTLDIEPEIVVLRGHEHKPYESGCDFSCSDSSFIRHQKKVREHVLNLSKDCQYKILDANLSIDSLFNQICDEIKSVVNTSSAVSAK